MVYVPVKNQLTSEDFMNKAKTLRSKINDQLWTSEKGNKIVSRTDRKKNTQLLKAELSRITIKQKSFPLLKYIYIYFEEQSFQVNRARIVVILFLLIEILRGERVGNLFKVA